MSPLPPHARTPNRRRSYGREALAIALIYACASALWILLSDRAVAWLVSDEVLAQLIGTLKGWVFVGVSALLIYLLLARRPQDATVEEMRASSPRSPWLGVGVIAALIAAVVGIAVEQAWRTERTKAGDQLLAVSRAKAQQITDWYEERLRDAQALQTRSGLIDYYRQWQAAPGTDTLQPVLERLGRLADAERTPRVELYAADGRQLWRSAGEDLSGEAPLQAALRKALDSRRAVHAGPWRDASGRLRLAFVVALAPDSPNPGLVALHVDPPPDVHDALRNWPLPHASAEAFLFERSGNEVLILSALKHERDAEGRRRLPLDAPEVFTARVLRGDDPPDVVLDGLDYRGVVSLAVAQRIGDSGWWILAKQDRYELMADALSTSLWMVLAGMLGLLSAAVGMYLLLQRRRLLISARDITELRRIERALSESESRYRLLAENGSDVVWLLDLASSRFVYVSPSVQRLRGYTVTEVLEQTLAEVLTPESLDRVQRELPARLAAFEAGEESARTQTHEVDQTRRDGSTVPTEVVTTLITDAQGQVTQVLGVSRDISSRREAEAQIIRLSQATEQSPASVIITSLDAKIEYVNAAFERISGYPRQEVLGRDPKLLQSGKTPRDTYAAMWTALSAGRSWSGEIINRHKTGRDFVQSVTVAPVRNSQGQTTHYLSVQLDVTAQRVAEEKAYQLAWFDPLTGLPNRHRLLDELSSTLASDRRTERQSALLLLNIDRFKTLNDALGHEAGDAVLQAVATRLQALLHPGDLLARLGADEFALLEHELDTEPESASAHALRRAQAVHNAMAAPIELSAGEQVNVSVSIGMAMLPKAGGDTPGEVLRRADTALHRAKSAGGQQSAFFDAAMGRVVSERFAIEQDLRRGIAAGELRLYLQPQVNRHGRIVSAEALVRWQHPTQGLVPPGVFIPVAEQCELIADVGDWVLHEVCQHLGEIRRQGLRLPIAVNVSPRQFHKADFVPAVLAELQRTGARADDLMLEITEGVVVEGVDQVIAKMGRLTEQGVRFSIDDFGTGYSSLAYLKRLPIHELKIDKSFVQDAPRDSSGAALVEAMLSVAHHLGLKVVAEGVETQQQADFLNARGEVLHQGYLFGRPEPAETLLQRWRAAQAPG